MAMRLHITLDEELVDELDELVGPRGRSAFIAESVKESVDRKRRWKLIESAAGAISDTGHEWDEDPAAWVHAQRRADPRRVG
jgi:metal-responsive CopG/Arc/MetJ family transcriptional regulator